MTFLQGAKWVLSSKRSAVYNVVLVLDLETGGLIGEYKHFWPSDSMNSCLMEMIKDVDRSFSHCLRGCTVLLMSSSTLC